MPLILNTAAAASPLVVLASHHFSKFPIKHLGSSRNFKPLSFPSSASPPSRLRRMSWLGKLGLGFGGRGSATDASSAIAQGPDDDVPAAGQEFAQFGAGCFWSVELGFQRVPGVTKTEVGYSQGNLHEPTYEDVCTGMTNHNEVVRLQYDPRECKYEDLLDLFWERHDPTTPNRQRRKKMTRMPTLCIYVASLDICVGADTDTKRRNDRSAITSMSTRIQSGERGKKDEGSGKLGRRGRRKRRESGGKR
ncbi:hypothetical protein BHM03_00000839 [Ensete ventricosum]|nr:hypothetical protein BHM03_00000839 [Ensete ventricosum]